MKPLPVALDYRPALLTSAGIGRAVRELARALAGREGIELHLFGHSLARARHVCRVPRGATLHRWPIPGRSLRWLRRIGLGSDRLSGSPRVFHWTDYIHPPIGHAAPVLTVHDLAFAANPDFHGRAQADELLARTRAAAQRARAVLVPSKATADAVRRVLGIAPAAVIPFGSDHVWRWAERNGEPPLGGRPYLLALGTIEPRKNHERLIASWSKHPTAELGLVVIGKRGWECEHAVESLRRAGQSGRPFEWHEGADDRTVFRYLRHASALVYPSLMEGFGFPPLEAMALGIPVVAGDTPALRELTDGCAILCDPEDDDAIAAALDRVMGDAHLRRRLSAEGSRRAARFTWAAAAEAHHRTYAEVLS